MQFVDKCKILVKAGNGGNGIVAWRREAHYPEGGPAGGDGGKGGNVIIIGDENVNSLFHLRYLKNIVAQNGQNGQPKNCFGRDGKDIYIKVPLGSQISDIASRKILFDVIHNQQKFILAHGGKGGHGNAFFKSSHNKAPTLYENGDKGEEIFIQIELKYIADVGLIGLPNAGKSTLISCLTNARPKIANYQFTTLNPVLGVMNCQKNNIVIADIPGLIEGASQNKGLGFNFLKHVERCHLLLHVVSLEENNAYEAYTIINNELKKYDKQLIKKVQLIVANKNDLDGTMDQFEQLKMKIKNKDLISISALKRQNIISLKELIFKNLKKSKNLAKKNIGKKTIKPLLVENKKNDLLNKDFTFVKKDNKWIIHSKYLSYWLSKIPLNTKDNICRFKEKMNNCRIDEILKNNGAKEKDSFFIDSVEFEIE